MRLDKKALGNALGIVWAITIFVATLWASGRDGGSTLGKLEGFYPGYSVSFAGAFIGLIYAYINGFIWGWLIAKFYNNFFKSRD
jgi:hypothetical protein